MFNISLTLVGVKVNPFSVFPAPHGGVGGSVGVFCPACLIEAMLPISCEPGFHGRTHRFAALCPECVELRLQQQRILKKCPRCTGHGSGSGFTLTEIRRIALASLPEFLSAPYCLPAQGRAVAQPLQIFGRLGTVTEKL